MMPWSLKVRAGVGIVVVYTAYTAYVQYKTSHHIDKRTSRHQLSLDNPNAVLEDVGNNENRSWPSTRFGSLIVGGKFVNPFPEYRHQTLYEFIYCRLIEVFHFGGRGSLPKDPKELKSSLPLVKPDFDLLFRLSKDYSSTRLTGVLDAISQDSTASSKHVMEKIENSPNDLLTLTWLGQSCAFVQMGGMNILTDPLFGNNLVSNYIGPRRLVPSPCKLEELPKIDLVLVSHDHPDHLELDTVKRIGNSALWVVPTGVRHFLAKQGIYNVAELDWWQHMNIPSSITTEPTNLRLGSNINNGTKNEWEIVCTPAMHWSGRKLIDANNTLWCSFMILRGGKPIFFHAGDTGYSSDLFNGIRNYFGRDCYLAMLPCGAYKPRWHLKTQHIDPNEAVQVMKDLGARKMVGVHWGTFVLSDEHYLDPKITMERLAKEEKRPDDILTPEFGKTLVFDISDNEAIVQKSKRTLIRDGKSVFVE
ncbi:Metallo-hydrolase/oxidoreductase [Nadsonia fulvescens var. elongata DSM 6958]|uniref:Metallo-hydrolase/oxidoreductase n=1 Tax=Nadsonia fulvescens var. elongata DSM 6958 TaxID=857566 RepID=A0A1E3PG31_9ASCO|nr:Metallo-hydrolase/oxidoreductase [Nadsonia fulvescens var. elongata DSM 6958]